MAKRMNTASRRRKTSRSSLLGTILIGVIILILYGTGVITPEDLGIEESTPVPATQIANAPQPPPGAAWYAVYFTTPINSNDEAAHHGSPLEQALIQHIDEAKSTIDAALFEINAPDTTAAFIRALERGVRVRFIFDDEHALEDPETTAQEIIAAGAEYRSDERSALMHNKFVVFDNQAVWTGATNLTRNGIYNNNNNAIYIQSADLAANYAFEFEELFTKGKFTRDADEDPIPYRVLNINGTQVETYFSPEDGDRIEARLGELINGAQRSIYVMAFAFTVDSLGEALIERAKAGVTVQGVFETTGSLQGVMKPLGCANIPVRQDGNPSIMHHKVFIFDERTVAMGSFNFSNNAINSNSENMLILDNPDIAAQYLAEFQRVFAQGSPPDASELDC